LKGKAQARARSPAADAEAQVYLRPLLKRRPKKVVEAAAEPTESGCTAETQAKPLVAMRGDDRPGMKKSEPMPAGRGGRFGDRKGRAGRALRRPAAAIAAVRVTATRASATARTADRAWATPRSGAQRDALEHAQSALRSSRRKRMARRSRS